MREKWGVVAHRGPPPAYFLSLTVENIRCFGPRQTLDLSDGNGKPRQWTVILGNNGVGKTTLLQALVLLNPTDSYRANWQSRFSAEFLRGDDLQADKRGIERHIEAELVRGASLPTSAFPVRVYLDIENQRVRHRGPNDLVLSLHCFAYGAARRMGTGALTEDSSADPFASLFRDEAPLRNAEEWLLQTDYAATKAPDRKEAQRRRDEVKAMLLEILPDVEDIAFVADAGDNPRRPKPAVRIKTPYGWVSLRDLSLGYKTLVAWTVDLASRLYETYYKSESPLAEPAVVLVDEIDLHLHPAWQRKLLSYLGERFRNTQFIVTAHSPLVVQAAADANIVVLRREGDHVVIDNDTENVRGWRVDQLLTSDLFGLPSARSAALDEAIDRRKQLLAKARLTAKDRRELSALEQEIGELPTGETPDDIRAMDIIRRAAAKLSAGGAR